MCIQAFFEYILVVAWAISVFVDMLAVHAMRAILVNLEINHTGLVCVCVTWSSLKLLLVVSLDFSFD